MNVQNRAKAAGASLTRRFGHLLAEVNAFREVNQTAALEADLRMIPGVMNASVTAVGIVMVEYDQQLTSPATMLAGIRQSGLTVRSVSRQPASNEPESEAGNYDHHDDHEHGSFFRSTEQQVTLPAEIFSHIVGGLII